MFFQGPLKIINLDFQGPVGKLKNEKSYNRVLFLKGWFNVCQRILIFLF